MPTLSHAGWLPRRGTLQRLSAVESAGINNTMLIQIAILAWLFLDEAPGPTGLVGIALISTGVFLTQALNKKTQKNADRG